ncbi:unnamed protein product [Brassica rapa subsp. narinosa]
MRVFPNSSMTILSVLLTTLLLSLPLPSTQDLNAERAALLSLRSSVGGRTFCWDIRHTSPCNWAGVKYDNNRVTALRLPASLSPAPSRTVKQILRQIPESLFSLTNLVRLNLAENSFTGGTDSPVDLTVPSLEFSARPRPRLGCGW